jgi:pyruvate dehydrogenase E2 component (dihydrolipoamide acetyltransferase)
MIDFTMPSLGADMEAGTLVEWMVKPGDRVKRGDVVAVVETAKGAIEIEIFEPGTVGEILVDVGSEVPVGTPLARIRSDGEAVAGPLAAAPPAAPVTAAPPQPERLAAPPPTAPSAPPHPPPTIEAAGIVPRRASPAARRLAAAESIDLTGLAGTGPQGAVVRADVERAVATAKPVAEKARGLDLDAMRLAIAAAMARSKREIPHYYLEHQVDLAFAQDWLARTNAERAPENRLLMAVLAVKAVARAARRFPAFNGFYRDGRFEAADAAHVGFAIAIRGGGLAAPALHEVDRLTLDELMTRMRDLIQRTRAGRMRSSEMTDATITVTSLGERGVEALYGIIYPPQVAIVGFGKVVTRPWVIDGAIGPRPIMTITLAADHRVSDGHAGALFLAEIGKQLQEPESL